MIISSPRRTSLTVTNGQFNVTSEPFSAALFADAEARGRIH